MIVHQFEPRGGPILVDAEVTGPIGIVVLKLVLDTGATTSLVNAATLLALGLDPADSTTTVAMVTGSSVLSVPMVTPTRLTALGQTRFGFPVIAHKLPKSSAVDGLLGLDFFRDRSLTIDFRAGRITLD